MVDTVLLMYVIGNLDLYNVVNDDYKKNYLNKFDKKYFHNDSDWKLSYTLK